MNPPRSKPARATGTPSAAPPRADSSSRAAAPPAAAESLVNVCDARDCRFNDGGGCRAGAVSIALVRGTPRCATYSPNKPG